MNKDIENIKDALENGDLLKTDVKLYIILWNAIKKYEKEQAYKEYYDYKNEEGM